MGHKKTGNPLGRPLAFSTTEELEDMIRRYYERCELKEKPLTLSGLAVFLGIDRKTLYNYSQKDDFFPTIKVAKDIIQADMEERALNGQSNATFSIFALKNNYGWQNVDKIESENVNTNINNNIDFSNMSTEQLKELINNED